MPTEEKQEETRILVQNPETSQPSSGNQCKRFLYIMGLLIVLVVIILAIAIPLSRSGKIESSDPTVRALNALAEVPLIDGHNDLAYTYRTTNQNRIREVDLTQNLTGIWPGETDIPRLRAGKVGGQFWSAYVSCNSQDKDAVRISFDQCDTIHRFVDLYPDTFQFVYNADDIMKAFNAGRIASLIGLEGGHSIDSSLATLRMFYKVGVRYMTLTHTCNTPWADSSPEDDKPDGGRNMGLSPFGETIVREMNRLGMFVDLSHVSKKTMEAALNVTRAPVIFSHSSSWALSHHHRNVQDDIIERMVDNGGVVMVNFFASFNNQPPNNKTVPDVAQVADHVEHIRNVSGVDHVGVGGDYNGASSYPAGLEDVSKYPNLFIELANRGWSEADLRKLAGENLIRAFKQVEKVRDDMKAEGIPPYDDLIPPEDLPENPCRPDF